MAFKFFASPIDVSPTANGTWIAVDMTAHVPAGTEAVIYHFHQPSLQSGAAFGVRKTGSSDAFKGTAATYSQFYGIVGLNGSLQFDATRADTNAKIYAIGYLTPGTGYWPTAWPDFTPTATTGWQTTDISAQVQGGDTPVAAVFWATSGTAWDRTAGARAYGGSADLTINLERTCMMVAPVDGSNRTELYRDSIDLSYRLVGYIKDSESLSMLSEGSYSPVSPESADVYFDIDGGDGLSGALVFVKTGGAGAANVVALRGNGDSQDYYGSAGADNGFWAIVKTDSAGLLEAKAKNLSATFTVLGLALAEPDLQTAATGEASGSAGLTTGINLGADAHGIATGAATIYDNQPLFDSAATATATVQAFLRTDILLASEPTGEATAGGYLAPDLQSSAIGTATVISSLLPRKQMSGDGDFYALEGEATTKDIFAEGDGVFGLLAGEGTTGAIGDGTFHAITGEAAGVKGKVAAGDGVLFAMSGEGATGAIGNGTFFTLDGEGAIILGHVATGSGTFESLAGESAASVYRQALGDGRFGLLHGAGAATKGHVGAGDGRLYPIGGESLAVKGHGADGDVDLYPLAGESVAFLNRNLDGDGAFYLLQGVGETSVPGRFDSYILYHRRPQ